MQEENNLQDRFAQFGATPSDNVWLGIENALDKKKNKLAFFWWTTLSAVVILAIGSIFYFSKNKNISSPILSAAKQENNFKVKTISNEQKKIRDKTQITTTEKTSFISATGKAEKTTYKINEGKKKQNEVKTINFDKKVYQSQGEKTKNTDINSIKEVVRNTSFQETPFYLKSKKLEVLNIWRENTIKLEKLAVLPSVFSRWELGVYLGSWTGFEQGTPVPMATAENEAIINATDNSFANTSIYTSPIIPIITPSIHLSAGYFFRPKWQLRIGAGYASYQYHIKGNEIVSNQSVIFGKALLLPAQVNYTILAKEKWRAQIGLGYTNTFLYTQFPEKKMAYLGDWQAHFGVQYKISNRFSLEAQPSVRMHFRDDSQSSFQKRVLLGARLGITFTPSK